MAVPLSFPAQEIQTASAQGGIALAHYCQQLFQAAREYRRPLVMTWQQNYLNLHVRDYWKNRNPQYPTPRLPEMWPIIAAMVGWMTDTRPGFEVAPVAEPFTPFKAYYDQLAQDLQNVLTANWIINDHDREIETMLWDANVYGTGILKVLWDPLKVGGLGDAVMRRVDPFTFYVDPNATKMENANFFVEVRQMTLQELDRTFPGKLDQVMTSMYERADATPNRIESTAMGQAPQLNLGAINGQDAQYGMNASRRTMRSPYEKVTVLEVWVRDHKRMTRMVAGEDGEEREEPYIFDGWRCIVCTNDVILLDRYATEMWEHGQHPYSRFVLQETGEFWGQSLVELLSPIQDSINWIAAMIEHHIYLTGNPIMMYDEQSGMASQAVTNAPGQKLKVHNGGNVQWLDPPQMDANLAAQMIQFYKSEMETVSGLSAIVRGFMPSGRNAQGVLEQVQESAFVRVRLALRNLERTIREAGEKMSSLIVEFYTTPRSVAIVGPTGEKSFQALKANHFYLPAADNDVAPMRYQLQTGAGSMLPTSRQSRSNLMMQLFALGVVDEEAVLETLQVPNWRIITARVRELKAAGLMQPPGARQRAARTN